MFRISRNLAIGIVAFRQCRNLRNRGVATIEETRPVFHRYRKELNLDKGTAREISKKVVVEDLERVLSKKEISEIKAKVKAEVLLSQ